MAGVHVVDAQDFTVSAAGRSGPLLIGHATNALVLSEVKLALLDALPAETHRRVLARLGLPDEQITEVALVDLDRVVDAGSPDLVVRRRRCAHHRR